MKRQTAQRRAILDTHAHAGLELATVYRNLGTLEADGEVIPVHLPGQSARFEPAGRGHHHHFSCEACGGVSELTSSCPVAVLESVTLSSRCPEHKSN